MSLVSRRFQLIPLAPVRLAYQIWCLLCVTFDVSSQLVGCSKSPWATIEGALKAVGEEGGREGKGRLSTPLADVGEAIKCVHNNIYGNF